MRKLTTLLVSLAFLGLSITNVNAQFAGGNGNPGTPYEIATAAQLAQLATYVNNGNTAYNSKCYVLNNDIDLSDYQAGEGWTPIGKYSNSLEYTFKGTFDGNKKVITGLKINTTTEEYAGLFGYTAGATIKQLGIENADIEINNPTSLCASASCIAGRINNSTISNCYTTGTVKCTAKLGPYAGGVVAFIYHSTISNCYSTAAVNGVTFDASGMALSFVGGIAGSMDYASEISNCVALNPGISSAAVTILVGRVVSKKDGGTLTNNIAFDKMVNPSGTTVWSNKGLTEIDGADYTVAQINADGTLGGRFTVANGWTIVNGKLPGFGHAVDMPLNLQITAGTELDPYLIYYTGDLKYLADYVNDGNGNSTTEKYYKLMNDIDLSSYDNWTPIGNNKDGSPSRRFKGNFNGNNKIITGLQINNNKFAVAGLFGYVEDGTIENLGIEGAYIVNNSASGSDVGIVAGYLINTSIFSCYTTGTVTSNSSNDSKTGGILGNAYYSSISHCYSTATVSCSNTGDSQRSYAYAGGVAGRLGGCTITNCYSTGAISSTVVNGTSYAGGLAGGISTGSVITMSVALNPGIYCAGSGAKNFGRVTGLNDGSSLKNNLAFAEMLNPAGNTTWNNKGLDNIDGKDITAQEINDDGTLENCFTSASGWTTADGKLPGLFGLTVNMPAHLAYTTGIEQLATSDKLRVYPNPTNGELKMENGDWRTENVEIYDTMGKKQQFSILNSQFSTQIDISHLPAGIYFLRVAGKTVKVIKQ